MRSAARSVLPEELLARHPFPGPGLAIRCLASEATLPLEPVPDGWLIPVHSVGVQGDSRSYRPCWRWRRFPAGKPTCRLTPPR